MTDGPAPRGFKIMTHKTKIIGLITYGILCAASLVLWGLDFMGVLILQ